MKAEKIYFYAAILFALSIPILVLSLDFLSSEFKLPELEASFLGILFLYMLFVDGIFANRASQKTFWQIVSFTTRDKVIFILCISVISALLNVLYLQLDFVNKLSVLFLLFLTAYLTFVFFSPQVQKELKEKFVVRKN